MVSQKLCVCNCSCEALIGAGLELVDTVHVPFTVLVKTFCAVPESGVWLNHFRGIPKGPRLTRSDVVFLDEEGRVLDLVENFTEVEFQPLHETAASALVLPAHSLASIEMHRGDQLRVCRADRTAVLAGQPLLPHELCTLIAEPSEKSKQTSRVAPDTPGTSEAAPRNRSLKERLLLWLYPEAENADRRRAPRLPAHDLVAYCWTGGSPLLCKIGNVSQSGLYLITDERWVPGTRVMMTLQKEDFNTAHDDEISRVESEVVRWGSDGIGCRFIESGFVDLNSGEILEGQVFDQAAFERFLAQVTGPPQA
jgi:hypothetical protein